MMTIRHLFATPLYIGEIDDQALLVALEDAARALAVEDKAGQGWSKAHGYPGYTSYASLNDLPVRDPAFADLEKALKPHVRSFAKEAHMALAKPPKLDSLWVNLLDATGAHSAHIHPHSIISGTLYIAVPRGAGALRLEDPRLPLFMAAPTRSENAPPEARPFYNVTPRPGMLILWESWLRHEVLPGAMLRRTGNERISISFNYR